MSRFSKAWRAPFALALIPCALGGQQRWSLTEDLRIGSPDGPAQFSDIRGLVVSAKGEILVLDYKTQDIRVFDARGSFVKRIGRTGSGPGEMRTANGMQLAPDGRLWVNDPANSRLTIFGSDGQFVTSYVLPIRGYGYIWNAMVDTAGRIFDQLFLPTSPGQSNSAVRRIRSTGVVLDTIPMRGCGRQRSAEEATFQAQSDRGRRVSSIPYVPSPVMAWDPRGFVWCSPTDVYEILQLRFGATDTTLHIIHAASPVPVTGAERDAAIAGVKDRFKDFPGAQFDFSRIPKAKPLLQGLDIDDQGNVWVRRTTADTMKTAIDVFDRSGRLIAVTEIPFRLSSYQPLVFRDGFVYAISRDEDDVPFVVREKIGRPREER